MNKLPFWPRGGVELAAQRGRKAKRDGRWKKMASIFFVFDFLSPGQFPTMSAAIRLILNCVLEAENSRNHAKRGRYVERETKTKRRRQNPSPADLEEWA